jgi:hypothetical protein
MVKPTCLAMPVAAKVAAETIHVRAMEKLGALELALLQQDVAGAKAANPKLHRFQIGVLTR